MCWCLSVSVLPSGVLSPVIPRGSTVHFSPVLLVPLAPALGAEAPGSPGGAAGAPVAGRGQPSKSAALRTVSLIPQ